MFFCPDHIYFFLLEAHHVVPYDSFFNLISSSLQVITLNSISIIVAEYIPFGANQIVQLNSTVGSTERVRGGFISPAVDDRAAGKNTVVSILSYQTSCVYMMVVSMAFIYVLYYCIYFSIYLFACEFIYAFMCVYMCVFVRVHVRVNDRITFMQLNIGENGDNTYND